MATTTKSNALEKTPCCACGVLLTDEEDVGNNADVADTCCETCFEKEMKAREEKTPICACGAEKGKGNCWECECDRDFWEMSPADYAKKWTMEKILAMKKADWEKTSPFAYVAEMKAEEAKSATTPCERGYQGLWALTDKCIGQTSNAVWEKANEILGATDGDRHTAFKFLFTAAGGKAYANEKMNEMKMKDRHENARDRLRRKVEARNATK